jgi:predicted subunit of tRNA(5-methylaminomethyl-2-thiouridylate) methyltransferase
MMTTSERIDRLERALAELAAGANWTPLAGHGRKVLDEICNEFYAVRAAEVSERRRRELEAELAGLGTAA